MRPIIVFLTGALLTGMAVYRLLPVLMHRLGEQQMSIALCQDSDDLRRWQKKRFQSPLLTRLEKRLRQAGLDKRDLKRLLFVLPAAPVLLFVAGFDPLRWLMTAVLFCCAGNSWISRRIYIRRKAFTLSLYKIYRFLDLQLEAGIKATDAFRGLPEAVQDRIVQPILIRFAANFELTLDLDKALLEIRTAFPGPDSDLLATHLRQCLQTGQAGRSLLRMEELLFARCFSLMQNDTQKIRFQLLLTALLGVSPFLLLFLFPLVMQTLSALHTVFG